MRIEERFGNKTETNASQQKRILHVRLVQVMADSATLEIPEIGVLDRVCLSSATSALSNLDFRLPSFPRRRESSAAIWIPACAGMTHNHNFKF